MFGEYPLNWLHFGRRLDSLRYNVQLTWEDSRRVSPYKNTITDIQPKLIGCLVSTSLPLILMARRHVGALARLCLCRVNNQVKPFIRQQRPITPQYPFTTPSTTSNGEARGSEHLPRTTRLFLHRTPPLKTTRLVCQEAHSTDRLMAAQIPPSGRACTRRTLLQTHWRQR